MALQNQTLMGGPIGANVNGVDSEPKFNLGARLTGVDGSVYQYVQAAEDITTAANGPNALAIDEDNQARLMTTALALAGHELGFAPIASTVADVPLIPDESYFFARLQGSNFQARVAASATSDTYLRTTIVAGRLGTASTASAVVFTGVVLVTAASASTSAGNSVREVLATQGRAVRQGQPIAAGFIS